MDELLYKNPEQYFREFEDVIGAEFKIQPDSGENSSHVEDLLLELEMFKQFDTITFSHLVHINSEAGPFYLFALDLYISRLYRKGGPEEFRGYEVFGLLNLRKNHAHILIKPETLRDKILDFFVHAEIDIPSHPQFSDSFYVLSNEPEAAKEFLTPGIMDLFCSAGDLWAEVKGGIMLIGYRQNISMEIGLKVAALARKFKAIL